MGGSVTGLRPAERALRISVVGAGAASSEEIHLATEVGRHLAKAGAVLICGGLGGVMGAAARGAREAGGRTVGLLPGTDADEANPWIELPLATGLGEARNLMVVRAGEAVIAVGGGWGTLSEIALARKIGRRVVTLGRPPAEGLGCPAANDPDDAVARALDFAREVRSGVSE
jgi:uncharacterized protein (TIGR00725 family)